MLSKTKTRVWLDHLLSGASSASAVLFIHAHRLWKILPARGQGCTSHSVDMAAALWISEGTCSTGDVSMAARPPIKSMFRLDRESASHVSACSTSGMPWIRAQK